MVLSHQSSKKHIMPPIVRNLEIFILQMLLTIDEKATFKDIEIPNLVKDFRKDGGRFCVLENV